MYEREAFMQYPHKRSKSETAYSMVKVATQGAPELPSDTGRLNEALCKVLAHDVRVLVQAIHELGIEPGLACTWRAYKHTNGQATGWRIGVHPRAGARRIAGSLSKKLILSPTRAPTLCLPGTAYA